MARCGRHLKVVPDAVGPGARLPTTSWWPRTRARAWPSLVIAP